jgi:RimJ/RimL family protein N-acetyltransferase
MRPAFLNGEQVYIRAVFPEDTKCAAAWYESVFPIYAERAEAILREDLQEMWAAKVARYVVVRSEDDAVIGGIVFKTDNQRTGEAKIHMAPYLSFDEADQYKAETIRLFVPWMRDEHEYMAVTVRIADDEPASIAAAEELDLYFGVRFRGYLRRPEGRVDLRLYQALNPKWEVVDA